MATNAHDIIKNDHHEVEQMYNRYHLATGKEKKELAHQILTALTIHTDIEERFYYPALTEANKQELVDEFNAEHQSAKVLIGKLRTMNVEEEAYDPNMKALMEAVLHHVEEEEGAMPEVERLVGIEKLEAIAPDMQARTKELRESGAKRFWAMIKP